jgi:hypothetical protein
VAGVLAGLLLACTAHAAVPARVEIKYRVLLGTLKIGEGLDVFEHDGRSYRIVSESKTTGLAAAIYRLNVRREAKGRITTAGLQPLSYDEVRNGKPKRGAQFDWDSRQARLTDEGNAQTLALPHNTWDSTSFGYQFAFAQPRGEQMAVNLTDGRRIKEYKYAFVGREKLDTELGPLETLHVKKVQAPDDKRAFDVWLAIEHHYLPVRIRYTERDGTVIDSVVTQINSK